MRFTYFNSNIDFYDMHDYLHHKIKLIKPHGSCNWHKAFSINRFSVGHQESVWQAVLTNNFSQEKIDSLLESTFYVAHYDAQKIGNGSFYQNIFPQIHIPLSSKDG